MYCLSMKLYLIISIVLFNSFFAFTQSGLDSLWNIWGNTNENDSIKKEAIYSIVKNVYERQELDTNYIFQRQASNLRGKEELKWKAEVYQLLALFSFEDLDYDQADYHQAIAVNYMRKIENPDEIAKALCFHAEYSIENHKLRFATLYINEALALFEQTNNIRGRADCYQKLAQIAWQIKDLDNSLDFSKKAYKLLEGTTYSKELATAMNNLGYNYQEIDLYKIAKRYYQRSLKISRKHGYRNVEANCLRNIGEIFQNLKEYNTAREYFQRSLQIKEKISGRDKGGWITVKIGEGWLETGDYQKALKYCSKGYELGVDYKRMETQRLGCDCLYKSYKAMKKNNQALKYYELYSAINDSLNFSETAIAIQQIKLDKIALEDSLAQQKKAEEIQLAHERQVQKKNQIRNILIGFGFLVIIVAIGLWSRLKHIRQSRATIQMEKNRSEKLLLNILPAEIAEELKLKGSADARNYSMVSILFTDFKGFTGLSSKLSAKELVEEINTCFVAFDAIILKYGIEKIKTIGDAYMAAGGMTNKNGNSVKNTILAALDMQQFIRERKSKLDAISKTAFEMRSGIHTGPIVAGIVGVKKFQYDIWGDAVNTASRMESSCEVGKVNISQTTYDYLKNDPDFVFESRGKIKAKGKGFIEMWYVSRAPLKSH